MLSLEQVTSVELRIKTLEIALRVTSNSDERRVAVPFTLRRRGVESRIVLAGGQKRDPDIALIKRIVRAMDWIEALRAGDTISSIADRENITPGHITHHIDLGFVSPKILLALANGTQRTDICARRISKLSIPPKWSEQDRLFLD